MQIFTIASERNECVNKLEKRKLTSKKIREHFALQGIEVDEKKASEILDLIYFFAKLIVKQNFKQ